MSNDDRVFNPWWNPIPPPDQNTNQGQGNQGQGNQGPIPVNSGFAWPNPYPQDPNYQYTAAPQVRQPAPATNQLQDQYQAQFENQYQNPFHKQQFQQPQTAPQTQNQPQSQGQNQLPQGTPPEQGWLPPGPQPLGRTGIPSYFSDLDDVHPRVNFTHPASGIFYYIKDGAQIPGESDAAYKERMRYAVERMGIEHRVRPLPPDISTYERGYSDRQHIADEHAFIRQTNAHQAAHIAKLQWGGKKYDAQYERDCVAAKQKRQAENAVQGHNAWQEVNNYFLQVGYDNLPPPDPADDSGEDLWEWGFKGPLPRKLKRLTAAERAQGLTQKGEVRVQATQASSGWGRSELDSGPYSTTAKAIKSHMTKEDIARQTQGLAGIGAKRSKQPGIGRGGWPSLSHCQRCLDLNLSRNTCGLAETGLPCNWCRRDRAECIPIKVTKRSTRYHEVYPNGRDGVFGADYRDRSEVGSTAAGTSRFGSEKPARPRSVSPSFSTSERSRSASPRRGGRAPPPSGPSGLQSGPKVGRCYNCFVANFPCDPQRPCIYCEVEGHECLDGEVDVDGNAVMLGESQALPRGPDTGGYGPAGTHEHLYGSVDSSLTYGMDQPTGRAQYMHPPQFDYSLRPPIGHVLDPTPAPRSIPSSFQSVRLSPGSSDQPGSDSELTRFANTVTAPDRSALANPASALSVLQNASNAWAASEPEAAPESENVDMDMDMDDYFDGGDVFAELFPDEDSYKASPPRRETMDPNLPEPEDHTMTKDLIDPNLVDPNLIDPNLINTPAAPAGGATQTRPLPASLVPRYDEDPDGPLLPALPVYGGDDMLGYMFGCMELKDTAAYWPQYLSIAGIDVEQCQKVPTRICEAFDHSDFYFCEPCQFNQPSFVNEDAVRAKRQMRHHYCQECAVVANAEIRDPTIELQISIGDCSCQLQLGRVRVCLSHRYTSILRMEKRSIISRARLAERDISLQFTCPKCNVRPSDVDSKAWRCLACFGHAVEPWV